MSSAGPRVACPPARRAARMMARRAARMMARRAARRAASGAGEGAGPGKTDPNTGNTSNQNINIMLKQRPLVGLSFLLFISLLLSVESAPVSDNPEILNITRLDGGDVFFVTGEECGVTRCMEVSGGTALSERPPGGPPPCACRCAGRLPLFREDRLACVADIDECSLAEFGSGEGASRIPFVFLPLSGQIIYPSRHIIFPEADSAVCAVAAAQFLTRTGWASLRNDADSDVPFSLYRDEGRTYLQWRGSEGTRARAGGRAVLARLACRAGGRALSPCVAFRLAGSPPDTPNDVSEVWFSRSALAGASAGRAAAAGVGEGDGEGGGAPGEGQGQGQGQEEGEGPPAGLAGAALAACAVLAAALYGAALVAYLRLKAGARALADRLQKEDETLANIKTNPLLSLDSFLVETQGRSMEPLPREGDSSSSSSGNSSEKPVEEKQHAPGCEHLIASNEAKKVSVTIHPQYESATHILVRTSSIGVQAVERCPEQSVAIVGVPEALQPIMPPAGPLRRKLYFNPAFLEPQNLKNPPPAAIEFLTKIREVIAIAKDKMLSKRFVPSLPSISEEFICRPLDFDLYFPYESLSPKHSALSLKRENSRKKKYCNGCPGCTDMKFHKTYMKTMSEKEFCKSCVASNFKQNIVRQWLDDVPVVDDSGSSKTLRKSHKSVAKISGTPRSVEPNSIKKNISIEPTKSCQDKSKQNGDKILINVTNEAKAASRKKMAAPPPPPPVRNESVKNSPELSRNITTTFAEVKRKEDEDRLIIIPPELKQKMNAVIDELSKFRRVEPIMPRSPSPVAEIVTPFIPKVVKTITPLVALPTTKFSYLNPSDLSNRHKEVDIWNKRIKNIGTFEVDSLERKTTKRRASLSNIDFGEIFALEVDRTHKRRSSIIAMEELEPMKKIHDMNSRLSRSYQGINLTSLEWDELDQVNANNDKSSIKYDSYSSEKTQLVSEVYINDFSNHTSTSWDREYSDPKPTLKVKYAEPIKKPGQLVIEVQESPETKIVKQVDDFDPDTLDRKPGKLKLHEINISASLPSQAPIEKIFLRSSGSFKSKAILNSTESLSDVIISNYPTMKIGSLREIYEARSKNNKQSQEISSTTNDNVILVQSEENQSKYENLNYLSTMPCTKSSPDLLSSNQNRSSARSLSSVFLNKRDNIGPPLPPKKIVGKRQNSLWNRQNTFRVHLQSNSTDQSDGPSDGRKSNGSSNKFRITRSEPYSYPYDTYKVDTHNYVSEKTQKYLPSREVIENKFSFNKFGDFNMDYDYHDLEKPTFHSLDPEYENYLGPDNAEHECYREVNTYEGLEFIGKTYNKVTKIGVQGNLKRPGRRSARYRHKKMTQTKSHKTEDSGYLSTDSNESRPQDSYILQARHKDGTEVTSESDEAESTGEARSESGGESVETNSVFFGSFRRLALNPGHRKFASMDNL